MFTSSNFLHNGRSHKCLQSLFGYELWMKNSFIPKIACSKLKSTKKNYNFDETIVVKIQEGSKY